MDISVIIPVFNEEENLKLLYKRMTDTLKKIGKSYELVFVNDCSKDSSLAILKDFAAQDKCVKVVSFEKNCGQHAAIVAGFESASGDLQITIDADLQNPPEEIEKIAAEFDRGFDHIATIRQTRNDTPFRKYASKAVNKVRKVITRVPITDQGCMMRGYSKALSNAILERADEHAFIPMLGYRMAKKPTEILINPAARNAGESKYNVFSLAKLAFNLFEKQDDGKPKLLLKNKYKIAEKIGF